ncbi:MAG: hypothetical protein FJW40_24810 [Acidobacteria bacterium]|nr:hypothetical protein [Acidobacteriota bacterium]
MRKLLFIVTALMAAPVLLAQGLSGTWQAEITPPNGSAKQTSTFTLKADGAALTGSVSQGKRQVEIRDGKVTGESFSFKTTNSGKKGEVTLLWTGKLEGGELKGTRGRDGGRRQAAFTAKRQ